MNLYEVHLKGYLEHFNPAYVVAKDLNSAYGIVLEWLNKEEYGFRSDRELDSIKILAEEYECTEYNRLFVSEKVDESDET